MRRNPTSFNKIFGSGPIGLLISLVLLLVANWLNQHLNLPSLSENRLLLNSIFLVTTLTTIVLISWSVASLPPADRGNKLRTTGAFKYVRHPLYAAFLSVFNVGLALYLNSCIFIVWAVVLHPLWHCLVQSEESQLIQVFGDRYLAYQRQTGQFLPKWHTLADFIHSVAAPGGNQSEHDGRR